MLSPIEILLHLPDEDEGRGKMTNDIDVHVHCRRWQRKSDIETKANLLYQTMKFIALYSYFLVVAFDSYYAT